MRFIKVEATKFTEVGYVGRDVESIIRDLVEIAVKRARDDALAGAAACAQYCRRAYLSTLFLMHLHKRLAHLIR